MTPFEQSGCALSGRRILVVEDDALIAMDLQDTLTANGAEWLGSAPTVAAALEALERARPDAVLLDMNLRGVRSIPVAQAARRLAIPFVLVTGYRRSELDDPALAEAPVVPKPVDRGRLVRVLAGALSPTCG